MNVYSLEHDNNEDPVFITRWLKKHHVTINHIKLFKGDPLPNPDKVDLLIIMGGPMNIYEEYSYPWLIPEKIFIRKVIDSEIPVLGICLGGQLISSALGGIITRSDLPEYGWHSVTRVSGSLEKLLHIGDISGKDLFPDEITIFQWHQDTYSIPTGAICLYTSETCRNQAFIYNSRVIGLQFHPEMDIPAIRGFLKQSRGFMREKGLLTIHDDILSRIHLCSRGNEFASGIMHYLTGFIRN
jgi:GMP synthase-like glutamine amidotransferase